MENNKNRRESREDANFRKMSFEEFIDEIFSDMQNEARDENLQHLEAAAQATYDVYRSFRKAGFSDDQAMHLTTLILKGALPQGGN